MPYGAVMNSVKTTKQLLLLMLISALPMQGVNADSIPHTAWPASWLLPFKTASELGVTNFTQSPTMAALVAKGELPSIEDRLPNDPVVVEPISNIGRYGGTAHVFNSDSDKINAAENGLFVDPTAAIILPNFIESWQFENDARSITLTLRAGLKWSDGAPVTSDDFIFFHRHVLLNKEISPAIPPQWNGSKTIRVSDTVVRFEFPEPFPLLINIFAQLGDYFIVPSHYMKQFHPAFVPREELEALIRSEGYISWMAYFTAIRLWTRNSLPLTPTMRAFQFVGRTPTAEFYDRNPYYWKVDPAGQQLPYIDHVRAERIDNQEVLAAKAATGQVDFAAFSLKTQDFPLFKLGEKTAGITTHVWNRIHGSDIIIQPNLTIENTDLRTLFQDFRFRKALSLAINREEMNNVIYFGRGVPRQPTVIPTSRFYDESFATAYTEFLPNVARSLLDEMGLVDIDGDGLREYPNENNLTITLEYIDFETPKNISLELVTAYWREVGLDIRLKQVDAALQNERARAGKMEMTVWHADRTTDILFPIQPQWYVPMRIAWEESHWNAWSRWFLSGGAQGEQPPPEIEILQTWWREMTETTDQARVTELGKNILRSTAENLWTIGTIGLAPQPVVISNRLKNVPAQGYWGWDNRWTMPYHPATWYLEE